MLSRDIDVYLEIAKRNNMKINTYHETHIHADFLCGSRELAACDGAKMYLSNKVLQNGQYEFEHGGLQHGR